MHLQNSVVIGIPLALKSVSLKLLLEKHTTLYMKLIKLNNFLGFPFFQYKQTKINAEIRF